MEDPSGNTNLNFNNSEIAFANHSNKELKKMEWLFSMMNKNWLVKLGSSLSLWAVNLRVPGAEFAIKNTIFEQFCGGENLMDCQKSIDKLDKCNTQTVLDYGAEGKDSDEDHDKTMNENIKAIEMAASNNSVPVVTTKLTGLISHSVLEKKNSKVGLDEMEEKKWDKLLYRIDKICSMAHQHGVAVFIDAEESWIQDPIDEVADTMMAKYNKDKVVVYNTYQLYRHDMLDRLKEDHKKALERGHLLGAKLVRGAYMEKERKRAEELGISSPIQPDKESTDRDYDAGIDYCFENYKTISFCCASHNVNSNKRLADKIEAAKLNKKHPHFNFCQLYGMSDNITFNLADAGFIASKYVPYGPIKDVIPYLIRRAQENSSVTGEMGRELAFIKQEIKRRKI